MQHHHGGSTAKFKKPKVNPELTGNKDAALGFSFDQIVQHCKQATKNHPKEMGNCVDLNCEIQKLYADCFDTLQDKKRCIQVLQEQFNNASTYRVSHIKWE